MRTNSFKSLLIQSGLAASVLLLGTGAAQAQQAINLTAGPTTTVLPDGSAVPMWGYSCGTPVAGSTATCAPLNAAAAAAGQWSPIIITVPTGQTLSVTLTNNLAFTPAGATTSNGVPTSLTIIGQLGGGLGLNGAGGETYAASPAHAPLGVTWATVNSANTGPTFNPPAQGARVQSFASEVAAGTTVTLPSWNTMRPGTYLMESGTHPSIQVPMGLLGMVVVTNAPTSSASTATPPVTTETAAGTAYPNVSYDADIPVLMSEIDPVQNAAVAKAVATAGFNETAAILVRDQISGVSVTNGGTGYAVGNAVTFVGGSPTTAATGTVSAVDSNGAITAVTITNAGAGYSAAPAVSVTSTSGANALLSASLTLAANSQVTCSGGAAACYPSAVNFTPLYFLINGTGFSRSNAGASLIASSPNLLAPTSGTGSVLVRLVNAGLHMHLPSIVGSQANFAATTTTAAGVANGFALVAEDGNPVPGLPRLQSDVFMAAGKTYDVMINGPAAGTTALPVFDRELSLSGAASERDAGMVAYLSINGAALPAATSGSNNPFATALANNDTYNAVVAGATLTVSNPAKGVIANDVNVYGVQLATAPTQGTLTLNTNGTFTYVASSTWSGSDTFLYCGNGTTPVSAKPICATVTLNADALAAAGGDTITLGSSSQLAFTGSSATYLKVQPPGLLTGALDADGLPLTVQIASVAASGVSLVTADKEGGFVVTGAAGAVGSITFTVQNSLGTTTATGTASVTFPAAPSGLNVTVLDGYDHKTVIQDYRWVIEEDQTFYVNPNCLSNPPGPTCPTVYNGIVPTLGVNFHTSHMPFIATGCTGPLSCEAGQMVVDPASGNHVPAVCDVGNGVCRPDTTGQGFTAVLPSSVQLDPTKRYYISILPGDAANPFAAGYSNNPNCVANAQNIGTPSATCGHGMGGAPITFGQSAVTVLTQPSPYPPGKLSIMVFEDDFPLNGEQDGGGGVDVLSPNEPGLGNFQIHLWDAMGGNGDFTGQMTYDMFNQPLTNSLDGMLDPSTGQNACPITQQGLIGNGGITGMIVTCPKYEADGATLSPLSGQAVIANLMPGRWGVVATPGADRIARGEEWLQTNTLDGQKAHDSFVRIGEPSYFQEFGPASFHVTIGFANPAIINARHTAVCNGTDANVSPGTNYACENTIIGQVTGERLSRTPDERLYGSGSHDAFAWTQCYVSFGDPDGEDFAFTKCDQNGNFKLTGLPDGDWRVTVFDQWNDQLVDGLSTPVGLGPQYATYGSNCNGPATTATTCDMGQVAGTQWETNMQTKTFIDNNASGVWNSSDAGIPFANVAVRLRDGSLENLLQTDFTGTANFNETFPLFSWYVVETDDTRYKNSGTHAVYDVGGPADGSLSTCVPAGTTKLASGYPVPSGTGYPLCGTSQIAQYLANTQEVVSLPPELRVPGAVYCAGADCAGKSIQNGPSSSDNVTCTYSQVNGVTVPNCTTVSSGRIDPPWAGGVEGWQGFPGQFSFLEFGKYPYAANETGGIRGHVIYASTRPFDDPSQLVQVQWVPLVPHVTINLYQEGTAADGVTPTLTLVDTTQTSSWDDYAQGFRKDAGGNMIPDANSPGSYIPNMNCPGQGSSSGTIPDLFFFALQDQPEYLDFYNNVLHGTGAGTTKLPYDSQFKCYDGMHNWNQVQPAPYDGMYSFPSVTAWDPATGKPVVNATNCKVCVANTYVPATDLYYGLPMLPPGKYVVEVVVPPGMELVKEEDKNILIGDNFIAPVTQEFGGLGNVYIMPDQASVSAAYSTYNSSVSSYSSYNANNAQNSTNSLGNNPLTGLVPGFTPEPLWPCVGELRIVPDYISLYPQTHQVSPFAGASRNLCDRKEVTLMPASHAIAKFYLFSSTHIASKFTGGITDDYTSEFDPFSPQFGEKFAPPQLPVSIKDWASNETNRVYADNWGAYDGMTYSTWEVNPPNPTGYSPTMMVLCMNDPGPITGPNGTQITDPLYSQGYSQFCYELPFMPGTTQYLDTPVVPTSAFAGAGYNNVDCYYPAATPVIKEVDGDAIGPWVSKAGNTLTITALGDQSVPNNGYSGPSATTAPFNSKTITRHYGFGSQCTAPASGSTTCNTASSVTIGGASATITSWSDTSITVQVPSSVPQCLIQQQREYGGPGVYGANGLTPALCGQLVITAGSGQSSIDTVTVTVGGKAPTHVAATGSIQAAIDAAAPGDLIIVDPTCTGVSAGVACTTAGFTDSLAAHDEMVLMWKPVRLQGVGAASSLINANTQPAGKLDPWRRRVNCLFGLALDGRPISTSNPFDSTGQYSCQGGSVNGNGTYTQGTGNFDGSTTAMNYFVPGFDGTGAILNPQVDRLPLEATVGWDATLNGNMAQLLQEPTLMGALEGAGITVLSKGANFPSNPFASDTFPNNTTLLVGPRGILGVSNTGVIDSQYFGDSNSVCTNRQGLNPFPSNFMCNPSSIDGLSITDSSQGGGGIFVHAWGHNLQIANNRIANNAGTLSGGINLGQGEFPPAYLAGAANVTLNAAPGSCIADNGYPANLVLPYCQNLNVNVHNNNISLNSSTGDELFSGTPAGAGAISFCTGSDYYKFNYNWVCGNLSSGDGGGLGHLGFSVNGDIEHNTFVFNQSLNPTIAANGGAMIIMGAPDVDPTCNTNNDADCVPTPGSVGPSDGIGRNLVINANLIMGNGAESGTGGGISFQNVNGSDVIAVPTEPQWWNNIKVTNNIIADNVAGWDGAGISLLDALHVDIINNTIVSNSTTATAGVLFNTLGSPLASQAGPTCTSNCGNTSAPQPAGIVAIQNSVAFGSNLPASITCPTNYYQSGTGTALRNGSGSTNGSCRYASYPQLLNNIVWQNTAFFVGIGSQPNTQYQQNVVTLYNAFNGTGVNNIVGTQTFTGQCLTGTSNWEIGVRGDTTPAGGGNHLLPGGLDVRLNPQYSILTDAADYAGTNTNNTASNPSLLSQYCDGSRQPPEFGQSGWAVPPGISDATVPNPLFNLTPVATVDEGNNWVNLRWGPLSLVNPVSQAVLGNYSIAQSSVAVGYIPSTAGNPYNAAPTTDFFGNPRGNAPGGDKRIDVGAVEVLPPPDAILGFGSTTGLTFANTVVGVTSATQSATVTNTGTVSAANFTVAIAGAYARATNGGTCGAALAAGASCTINVVFKPTAAGSTTGSLTVSSTTALAPASITLQGTGVEPTVTLTGGTNGAYTFTGSTADGSTSAAHTFTLTSNGPLTSIDPQIPAGFVRSGGTCGTTMTAAGNCSIAIEFAPVAPDSGTVTGSFVVSANDAGATPVSVAVGGSPVTLNGTARALAVVGFSGPTPSLVTGGTAAHSGTITVSNTGSGSLTLTAVPTVAKVGTAGGTFAIVAPASGTRCVSGTVVAVGGSCTIGVQYTPPATGNRTATATAHVTISDTGAAAGTQTSANFTAN
jgi:hypothetical protein